MLVKTQDFESFIEELSEKSTNCKFSVDLIEEQRRGIWIDFGMIAMAPSDNDNYFEDIENEILEEDTSLEFETQIECGPTLYAWVFFNLKKNQENIEFPVESFKKFITNVSSIVKSHQ